MLYFTYKYCSANIHRAHKYGKRKLNRTSLTYEMKSHWFLRELKCAGVMQE